jgi:hypothetical protein
MSCDERRLRECRGVSRVAGGLASLACVDRVVEEVVIRSFIQPRKRAQYITRLGSTKTRQKFMNGHLCHMRDLDPRYAYRIPPGQQNSEDVLRLLRERGSCDRCYVISGSSDYDGEEVDLRLALDELFSSSIAGTFIVCGAERLGYFQGEEPGEGYILERR